MTGSNKETYVGWRVMLESCQKMRELLFKTQIISSMFIVASNYILPHLKKKIDELNKMFNPWDNTAQDQSISEVFMLWNTNMILKP